MADAVVSGATLHAGSTRRRGRGAGESPSCYWSLGDKGSAARIQ